MTPSLPHDEHVDVTAIESRAHELRAEATAAVVRSAWTWLNDHLHFGKSHSPS